jgi:hypothetical protein
MFGALQAGVPTPSAPPQEMNVPPREMNVPPQEMNVPTQTLSVPTQTPSVPTPSVPIPSVPPPQTHCESIGDSILESMFNPNCGLDVYETCDETTWVRCKLASSRLGFYVFAFILVIVMLIVFFATDGFGKIAVVVIGAGLFAAAYYGSTSWIEKTARVEYQRTEKEIEGMMRRGNIDRSEAVKQLRKEKLSRERNAAIRGPGSQPAEAGLVAGLTSGLINALNKRGNTK